MANPLEDYDLSQLKIRSSKQCSVGGGQMFYLSYGSLGTVQPIQTPPMSCTFNVRVQEPTTGNSVYCSPTVTMDPAELDDQTSDVAKFHDFWLKFEERCKELLCQHADFGGTMDDLGPTTDKWKSAITVDEAGKYPPSWRVKVDVGSTVSAAQDNPRSRKNKFLKLAAYDTEGTNVKVTELEGQAIPRNSVVSFVAYPRYIFAAFKCKTVVLQTFTDMCQLYELAPYIPDVEDGGGRGEADDPSRYTEKPPNFATMKRTSTAAGFVGFETSRDEVDSATDAFNAINKRSRHD